MAINFPDAPTNGQEYTVGTKTWAYDSTAGVWNVKPGALTANGVAYASTATTIATLAVTANGVLVTSGTGAPSISTNLPAVTIASQGTAAASVTRKDYVDTTAISMSITFGY